MRLILLGTALLFTISPCFSQTATGSIIGRVTDASGAVVAGVEITALNPAKGLVTRATTDDTGLYRLLYLEPASYNLTYGKAGFAGIEKTGVALRSNDTITVDTQLNLGSVVEKVDVTTDTPLLETATSTTGTVLSGRQMNALPIQQRYTWMAMYMMPGVTSMNGFHIAGQRDRGLGYTMDGISGTEPIRGGVATNRIMSTTQNAIEEVKMVTTVLPAENGHSAGGLMSATYKSGTNQLHGEAEDRYLNNALKHRDYFQLARPTSPFTYHELAALFTGPLVIPKLYDGRNRTFFLAGWSRHHEKNDTQLFSTVPTPEMLGGNFSFNGLGFPIYDPATTRQNANGQWVRDPFPGNIIPANRIDPAVANFLGYQPWKAPNNYAGAGFVDRTGPSQNIGAENKYRSYRTRYDIKIDHAVSNSNRMFGRFSHVRNRARGNEIGLNWELVDGNFVLVPSDQINGVISDTHIFRPTIINELRLGVNRRKESRTPMGIDENWGQTLGIPGISGATFPSFFNSAGLPFYGAAMPGGSYYQVTENFTLQDNLTIIKGRHAMKTGYELLRTRADTRLASTPGGVYRFGGTDYPFTPNTGNDFAAFLLGSVVRADFSTGLANWLPRWWSNALYFQDDWSVSPKLTLNLGVRWSYETPFATKYSQQSQFDPTVTDPLTGRLGAITHPTGGLAKRDLNNFQPRIGLAYRISNKQVFRGGFGLTTIDLFTAGLEQNFEEYFTSVTRQQPSGDPRPAFYLSQGPGPIGFNILPNGTSPFVGTNYAGRNATQYDPNLRSPYSMNWNATYQNQFASSWLMELSYQGSAGVGLLNAWDTNVIPLNISNDTNVLNRVFSDQQTYKPYPQFGSIKLWSNFGHSSFHSGTLKFEKRYSRGLTLTSFYTWSKAMDESDADDLATGITYYNRRLEKGRAGFDVTHRSVTYATWELPFGKDRKWMKSGGWMNQVFGNWNLSGVQTFQSGTPVTFTFTGSPNRYLPGVYRPNQILPNDQVTVDNWTIGDRFNNNLKNPIWNIAAFQFPAAYTAGTVGRNTIEGPGMIWTQGSLAKTVKMTERLNLDLRFDINNVFKRPNFVNPGSVVNLVNPALFGKPVTTLGGFCCLGGQFVGTFVAKLYF